MNTSISLPQNEWELVIQSLDFMIHNLDHDLALLEGFDNPQARCEKLEQVYKLRITRKQIKKVLKIA